MKGKEKVFCVYIHTNLINGKVYIGKTCAKDVKYRWGRDGSGYLRCSRGHNKADQRHFANAIKKYGWENFKHEVLFEGLTSGEACKKEKELINLYGSNDPSKGYNMTEGGEGCVGKVVTQETRDLIKESLKKYRNIYQYDKKGNFIKVWKDCEEIINVLGGSCGNLHSHLNGKQKSHKGFIFKLEKTDDVQYCIKTTAKSIRCYSLDGKYIKTYSSYREALKETGAQPSMILRSIRGECVSAGGFVWREDVGDYRNIEVRGKYEMNYSPVLQIDKSGNVVGEYESVKDAIEKTGIANISAVCRRLRKEAGGYVWKYKGEYKECERRRKWDYEACYSEAKKYTTKTEFEYGSCGAYSVACAKGWLEDYTWFVDGRKRNAENQRKWTKETCYELALTCRSRGEMKEKSNAGYNVARKNGWLEGYDWFVHQGKPRNFWTYERCFDEAKKYSTLSDFHKGSRGAYNAARRNGWIDEYDWFIRK